MKDFKVVLQLYSIRDDMAADMDAALRRVKEIGYDYVEFAGYYDHSAEEIRGLLDKYGLECVSVHQEYSVFLEKGQDAVDFLKTIGVKYSAVPWMGEEKHKGSKRFAQTVEEFKKVGKLLKDNGIQFLYHNHDFEFKKYDGKFLLDWLYESLPEDLLQTEIDTCWVRYAGYDPSEYIKKYTGRAPVVHLKDFVAKTFAAGPVYDLIDEKGRVDDLEAKSKEDNGFHFKPIGQGVQDFKSILAASEEAGAEYVVVEQDLSDDIPPMEAAKQSREYLRSLGL